jgi:lysophospholipase L1-like esterase
MFVRTRSLVAVVVLTLIAGCSPMPCTGCMDVGGPELTCPSDVTVSNASASGQIVNYPTPTEAGGTPPVRTTCVPASGAVFPVGTTTVGCSARDAINRSAVCSFHVTLTSSPRLGAMSFLAYGDSTTAGENGDDPPPPGSGFSETYTPPPCGTTSLQSAARTLGAGQAHPQYFNPAISYPQQLLNMLKGRFPGESFTMENEGDPGEESAAGVGRLKDCFHTGDHPDVMLLLEGINDIFAGTDPVTGENYTPTQKEIRNIITNLQCDVSRAISNGVSFVFVSTILPIANCAADSPCRGADPSDSSMLGRANGVIDQVNQMIRTTIGGATIVEGNAAFIAADPTLATLIEDDGLHPTPDGYRVLAQAWMNAIASHIPVTSLRRVRR